MHSDASLTLAELSRLNAVVRRPRTAVWFPLLAFGLAAAGGAMLAPAIGRDDLGKYFLPVHALAGILSAIHYRNRGKTTGVQVPIAVWLSVIFAASVVGALASFTGAERGWDLLNLAGPGLALMTGYTILAAWSRSVLLLLLVAGIGVSSAGVLLVAEGDRAIGLQLAAWAAMMLCLSAVNYRSRSEAR